MTQGYDYARLRQAAGRVNLDQRRQASSVLPVTLRMQVQELRV